jgi:hypothetical protein
MPSQSDGGYDMRGRGATCAHCGHRVTVRGQEVWKAIGLDARLRIVAADRDGAIVEQVGREHLESRWGISYRDLLTGYRKEH